MKQEREEEDEREEGSQKGGKREGKFRKIGSTRLRKF